MPLLIGTCRLADLIGTPKAGFLVVSPIAPDSLPAAAALGSTAPRFMPIIIENSGGGVLEWQAHIQGGSPWLSLMETSGAAPDTLFVRMDPTGLALGVYRDTVVVAATGASGVAQQTPIRFDIDPCTENAILVNDSLVDTITSADCGAPHRAGRYARIYRFDGTANDLISIYLAAGFDGYVFLDTSLAPTSLPLNAQDDCLGAPGNPCIFYQQLPTTRPYWVEVTSFAAAESGAFTLQVPLPRAPNPPTLLTQLSDSVTSIPSGGTLGQTTIILSGIVSDRDLGDLVHLEAEVRPNATPFNDTPTGSGGANVANGQRATVAANVLDNTAYHWRIRAVDNTGRPGNWVAFGGNPDFRVDVPQPPNGPSGMSQSKPDGTPLTVGAVADTDLVILSATVTDPDPGDQLRLQVEVKPIGIAFADVPTDSSPAVATGIAQDTVGPLGNNTSYHWQARTSDQTGRTSAWVRFGGNAEPNGVDFRIALPGIPNAVTALAQYQNDGTTSLLLGGVTATQSVVLKGIVSDPDVGQTVQMEVEVKPTSVPFTNVPNYSSTSVANGALASVAVGPLADNTDYHWQARARDATNRTGAWVSFPQPTPNLETAADFRVQQPPVQLVFTVQPPASTVAGVTMTPPIQVTARDINGQTSTGFDRNVVMTLENAPGATLLGTTTVAAVAGVATFGDLRINKSGSGYILRATTSAPSLTQTSTAFAIAAAATSQLVFTTNPPASTQAGASMTPAIVVTAQDAFLNNTPIFTGPVTLSITPGTGAASAILTGGGPVNAVGGSATFAGASIQRSGAGYTLTASSGVLKPDTSTAFNITSGPPTKLAFLVPPVTTPAAVPIAPPVQVEARDVNDNRATSFGGSVTMAISTNPPGNGILSGTNPVTAVAGVAVFSNLSIGQLGTGYTLTASSAPLTQTPLSALFNIINSPISATLSTVVVTTPITACAAGCTTGGGTASLITVTARDGAGQPVQGATVVLSATGTGNTLTQPATTTNASGVATGTLSSTSTIDLKVLSAVISGVPIVQTGTVTVNAGTMTSLVFTQAPTNTTAGVAITPAVVVTGRDQFGNTATSFGGNVSMAIFNNPGPGVLTGTTIVPAVAGVATFSSLHIAKSANSYTLQASTTVPSLSVVSGAFNIVPAPPNLLTFTTQPTQTAVLARIDSAIGGVVVTVQDSVGNTTPSFAGQVRIILGTTAGGTLTGGGFITPVAGVATFPNLTLNVIGSYSLVTTSTGPSLISDESVLFSIIPGPAKTLSFTAQPIQTVAGQIIFSTMGGAPVQVTARDIQGNVATGFAGNVTMAVGTNGGTPPGTLSGTLTQPASLGVATFNNLSINNAGPGYTLTASTPALPSGPVTGATSTPFNIISGGVSAINSTITRAPTSITASGGTITSTITVTARDNLNNPIQGLAVVLGATGTGNFLTQPVATTNASGVATGTLASTVAETKTVSATIDGTLINATTTVVVNPAAAKLLLFNVQPNATVATQIIRSGTGVQVEVRDTFNNRVTTASNNVNIAILNNAGTPIPGALSGTQTRTPVGGIVTFNDLSIDKIGTGYTLLTSSTGLVSDTSALFNITVGVATKLGFVQQPTSTGGGATIAPPITVEVQDAGGNRVNSSANITLAIASNPGGGALLGDSVNNAVSGLATFNTLSINNAGTGYTLQATATGLTPATSSSFNITVGGAAKLGFVQQPSNTTGGATLSAVTVEIQDAGGNRVLGATNSVTLAIGVNAGPGAALTGGSSTAAVNGLATFSSLSIDSAGTGYTLVATSGILTQATSNTFNITVGSATKLGFRVQPSNTAGGASITLAPQVEVQDAGGNRVTGASNSITLAIGVNPGPNGSLSGTNPVSAISGVATFSGMSIDSAGNGYTLVATAGGLTQATSSAFNITVGAAAELGFLQHPTQTNGGANISPAVTVEIRDLGGNRVNSGANVTIDFGNNPGGAGTLSGTTTVGASAGLATFSTLSIDRAANGYTLSATSGSLTGATSNAFNIIVGTPAKLAFLQQPTSATAGVAFSPAITVRVLDAGNNLVTTATNTVDIAILNNAGGGTLSGDASNAASGGVATFNNLSIEKAGTPYTLRATSGSLTGVTSAGFAITAGAAHHLAFLLQPANGKVAPDVIAPPVEVEILDQFDNRVTTATDDVTMAIGIDASGSTATLGGTTIVAAVSGVATFSDLSIDLPGNGYTLDASATGLTGAGSNTFNMTP